MRVTTLLSAMAVTSGLEPVVKINKALPPKHPDNRLARLNMFCLILADAHFNGEGPVGRACNNWSQSMSSSFYKKCGYFNDEIRNGGPPPDLVYKPPNNEMNEYYQPKPVKGGKKKRTRRSGEEVNQGWADVGGVNQFLDGFFVEDCMDDEEDDADCEVDLGAASPRAPGDQRKMKLRKMGPLKSGKAILAGYRKYADRYLPRCHGWRRGNQVARRLKFVEKIEKSIIKFFVCDNETRSECAIDDEKCIQRTCPTEGGDRTLMDRFNWGKSAKPYILG